MTKEQIIDFVKSGERVLKFDTMLPISKVEDVLKSIGFKDLQLDGDETNGWQVDFWYTFSSEEYGDYMLAGSLHYGGFVLERRDQDGYYKIIYLF